jgi:hypothetical protein
LVELLKTRFINPNFPQGQALTMLEAIRFSYRFMQTLVDTNAKDPKIRFAKLIAFLHEWQPLVEAIEALLHPDPCKRPQLEPCSAKEDFQNWVYCYFEPVGKLIVLESGQGPELIFSVYIRWRPGDKPIITNSLEGALIDPSSGATLGLFHPGGVISKIEGQQFAQVNLDLTVTDLNGNLLTGIFEIKATVNGVDMGVAVIREGRLSGIAPYTTVAWTDSNNYLRI